MRERLLKWAPWVGYPLFYLLCLVVFAALTFPYDKLRERIVATFNAQQRATGGQQELQIDEMTGYRLSGVRMKGVRLVTASPDPTKPAQKIEIDDAVVRYQILPMLAGNTSMWFDVAAFGGEASGWYEVRGKDKSVDVTLDGIDLGKVDPLVQALGLPLEGRVSGKVLVSMPEGKASKGSGSVSIDMQDVAVGDGKSKLKTDLGELTVPKMTVGALSFTADAKDGVMKITKLVAGGKDLELQGEGRITMRELATDSIVDATVRFKVNDAYRTKTEMTKTVFGAPGSNVPPLLDASPVVKQSKRADGFYGWAIRGPLGRLGRDSFTPAGGGGAPSVTMPGLGGFGVTAPKGAMGP